MLGYTVFQLVLDEFCCIFIYEREGKKNEKHFGFFSSFWCGKQKHIQGRNEKLVEIQPYTIKNPFRYIQQFKHKSEHWKLFKWQLIPNKEFKVQVKGNKKEIRRTTLLNTFQVRLFQKWGYHTTSAPSTPARETSRTRLCYNAMTVGLHRKQ